MIHVTELIVDAYDCEGPLADAAVIAEAARRAAHRVGATIAREATHAFQPHGLTICLVLQESHLVVSTWPEHRMAIANVFFCTPDLDPTLSWEILAGVLRPRQTVMHRVPHRLGPGMVPIAIRPSNEDLAPFPR